MANRDRLSDDEPPRTPDDVRGRTDEIDDDELDEVDDSEDADDEDVDEAE